MAQAEEIRTETGPLDYDYTEKEVELCQGNLQNHKACSPDKIKNEMLNGTCGRARRLDRHIVSEMAEGTFLTFICTWPEKEAQAKVVSSVFGELKKQAGSVLGMDLTEYTWAKVRFGHDVEALDDVHDIALLDVKSQSSLIAIAPRSLLPPRLKPNDGTEEEDELAKKFRGLTPENVLKKLSQAKGARRKLCVEYMEMFTSDVLKSKSFLRIPAKVVAGLFARDGLSASETELFLAAVKWGEALLELKEQKNNEQNLTDVLKDVLPTIRFPTMTTEDIATLVAPVGVLSEVQILQLFTYIAASEDGREPGEEIAMFKTKPRTGGSSYGKLGDHTRDFSVINLVGTWSWGSADNVTGTRLDTSPLSFGLLTPVLNGTALEQWKAGAGWTLPRGGTHRVGIYSYPGTGHRIELEFSKGRMMCVCDVQTISYRLAKTGEWTNLPYTPDQLPVLGNGSNLSMWIDVKFSRPTPMNQIQIAANGGQISFHCIEFTIGR
eukprot:g3426.t1